MTTEPDPQTQLYEAFDGLLADDEQWRVTPSLGCVTVTRGWPDGSTDILVFLSPENAHGVREDARGQYVWSVRGTAQEIVAAARELAGPFAPGAPTMVVARGVTRRTHAGRPPGPGG